MATAVAEKIDFDGLAAPVAVSSRKEAVALSRAGQDAVHEHMTDPRVYRAASELIEGSRRGRKVDIEAYGYPFDVLENVYEQLQSIGASHYVSDQIMGALQEYITNLGSDFSREAKAKPLYARIAVVNQMPDDLPECEQTQATMIDGVRKVGGEAARVNVQATLYGTKSTTSQGVDLGAMFSSKTDGLFVFFGAPSNEAIKGFDSVDNALVNLMQGMVGGGASAAVIEEIKDAIKNGEAAPEMLTLIDSLATLQQLSEAAMTPGALENPQAQIAAIVADITSQIQSGMESGAIPPALVEGSVAVLTDMAAHESMAAIITPEAVQQIIPDNDNNTLDQQIAALSEALGELAGMENVDADTRAIIEQKIEQLQTGDMEAAEVQAVINDIGSVVADLPAAEAITAQVSVVEAQMADVAQTIAPDLPIMDRLPALAEQGAADLAIVIEALQQADAPLPEALAEIVQKLDGKAITPEQIAEALKGQGEMAGDVQAIVLALADPEIQQALPQETLNVVNQFTAAQPDLMEAVATVAIVQNFETALATIAPGSPEAAQIEQTVADLKDGTHSIKTMDTQTLAPVIAQLQGTPAAAVIQQAAQVVNNTQAAPVVLNNDTLAVVAAVAEAPGLDDATRQEISDLVQKGDAQAIADFIEQNPTVIQNAPPEVQTMLEQVADAAKINTDVSAVTVESAPVVPVAEADAGHKVDAPVGEASVLEAPVAEIKADAPKTPDATRNTVLVDNVAAAAAPAEPSAPRSVETVSVQVPAAETTARGIETNVSDTSVNASAPAQPAAPAETTVIEKAAPSQPSSPAPVNQSPAAAPVAEGNDPGPVITASKGAAAPVAASPSSAQQTAASKAQTTTAPQAPQGQPEAPRAAATTQTNTAPVKAQTAPATAGAAAKASGQSNATENVQQGGNPAKPVTPKTDENKIVAPAARNDNQEPAQARGTVDAEARKATTAKSVEDIDLSDLKEEFKGCADGCGTCNACPTGSEAEGPKTAKPETTSFGMGVANGINPINTLSDASSNYASAPVAVTITGIEGIDLSSLKQEFGGCADGCGTCNACDATTETDSKVSAERATSLTPARHIG